MKNKFLPIFIIVIVIVIAAIILFFTNTKKDVNIDLALAKQNVTDLKYTDKNNTETGLFSQMTEPDSEELMSAYDIDTNLFDQYTINFPMLLTQSSLYMIILPKEGKADEVKTQMANFFKNYEEQWKVYLPVQYDLVKNRLETSKGKYLIYVVSEDNTKVLDAINKAVK